MDIKSFAAGLAVGCCAPDPSNKTEYTNYMKIILPQYGLNIDDLADLMISELDIIKMKIHSEVSTMIKKNTLQ